MTEILIVEDDAVSARVLAEELRQFKIDTQIADSLMACFSMLHQYQPHLICLDLQLRDQGGLEFLQIRKQIPSLMSIPVIVVSGSADLHTIRMAMKEGADGYLIKPIQRELMKKSLEELGFQI